MGSGCGGIRLRAPCHGDLQALSPADDCEPGGIPCGVRLLCRRQVCHGPDLRPIDPGDDIPHLEPRRRGGSAGVLLANSTLLQVLTALGLPAPAAKLITEVTLFSVSFSVQTLVIFRGKKPEKKEAARHVHA